MDGDGGGSAAANHGNLSLASSPLGRTGRRVCNLPDHLLVRILVHIPTKEAVKTSILSRRWRHVWTQLTALTFKGREVPVAARVLAAHAATAIHSLTVSSKQIDASQAVALLRAAAPLLSGGLHFDNSYGLTGTELGWDLLSVDRGAFELPCFNKATEIWFDLGFVGLSLPPNGVFSELRVLWLENIRFQGQFRHSQTMYPSLQELTIRRTVDLVSLELESQSLVYLDLYQVRGLQRLKIMAPVLKLLNVRFCFCDAPTLSVHVAAGSLKELRWWDPYDPVSVRFGEMAHLCRLGAPPISSFWPEGSRMVQSYLRFLNPFRAVHHLELEINLKRFNELNDCSLNCTCDQPPNWRTQEISMKALEELCIVNFNEMAHEVDFVRQLCRSAPKLGRVTISSDSGRTASVDSIERLCPERCEFEFYGYRYILPEITQNQERAMAKTTVDTDSFSSLSEDVLLLILSRLSDTKEAAKTSALSRNWRNLWVKLTTLDLRSNTVSAALAAYEDCGGAGIRRLNVLADDDPKEAEPDTIASWLRFAESRVSEEIFFKNRCLVSEDNLEMELLEEEMVDRGELELPCITKATSVRLSLGFLGLALPPTGIFGSLTALFLEYFRFQGQLSFNGTMFPSLLELTIKRTRELVSLEVDSDSLSELALLDLQGFEQLDVKARALKVFTMQICFLDAAAPVANIAAESLEELRWEDLYDESSVSLVPMPGLRLLSAPPISRSWHQESRWDNICANFLKRFSAVDCLELHVDMDVNVGIPENLQHINESMLFMEKIIIPDTEVLRLSLCIYGHSFGASVLQLLTKCTRVKRLVLTFYGDDEDSCSSDCTCDQPPDWRTRDFSVMAFEAVDIKNFSGEVHEVDFVKQLFRSSPNLEGVRTEWKGSTTTITRHMIFAVSSALPQQALNLCEEMDEDDAQRFGTE